MNGYGFEILQHSVQFFGGLVDGALSEPSVALASAMSLALLALGGALVRERAGASGWSDAALPTAAPAAGSPADAAVARAAAASGGAAGEALLGVVTPGGGE